jgi:hypothetical protein
LKFPTTVVPSAAKVSPENKLSLFSHAMFKVNL